LLTAAGGKIVIYLCQYIGSIHCQKSNFLRSIIIGVLKGVVLVMVALSGWFNRDIKWKKLTRCQNVLSVVG